MKWDTNQPFDFQQDARDPLTELNLTESSELWLIQWPINQPPDFDGQEVTLNLHHDGHLGSLEGSSGKSYDIVSFASQDPDATVFLSSPSESKIVGKIARRVSLVHYPEPSELQKHSSNNPKQMYERSSATVTISGHRFTTPTQSIRSRHMQAESGFVTSSHGSGRRGSALFASGGASKAPKKRHADEPTWSMDQSAHASERSHNVAASSGSLGGHSHSQERKSKKKKNKS